jgi:hypothetical protein
MSGPQSVQQRPPSPIPATPLPVSSALPSALVGERKTELREPNVAIGSSSLASPSPLSAAFVQPGVTQARAVREEPPALAEGKSVTLLARDTDGSLSLDPRGVRWLRDQKGPIVVFMGDQRTGKSFLASNVVNREGAFISSDGKPTSMGITATHGQHCTVLDLEGADDRHASEILPMMIPAFGVASSIVFCVAGQQGRNRLFDHVEEYVSHAKRNVSDDKKSEPLADLTVVFNDFKFDESGHTNVKRYFDPEYGDKRDRQRAARINSLFRSSINVVVFPHVPHGRGNLTFAERPQEFLDSRDELLRLIGESFRRSPERSGIQVASAFEQMFAQASAKSVNMLSIWETAQKDEVRVITEEILQDYKAPEISGITALTTDEAVTLGATSLARALATLVAQRFGIPELNAESQKILLETVQRILKERLQLEKLKDKSKTERLAAEKNVRELEAKAQAVPDIDRAIVDIDEAPVILRTPETFTIIGHKVILGDHKNAEDITRAKKLRVIVTGEVEIYGTLPQAGSDIFIATPVLRSFTAVLNASGEHAPDYKANVPPDVAGEAGARGGDGLPAHAITVSALQHLGALQLFATGGNGGRGQDGAKGATGAPGAAGSGTTPGGRGGQGGNGGNAGASGSGGRGGLVRLTLGQADLKIAQADGKTHVGVGPEHGIDINSRGGAGGKAANGGAVGDGGPGGAAGSYQVEIVGHHRFMRHRHRHWETRSSGSAGQGPAGQAAGAPGHVGAPGAAQAPEIITGPAALRIIAQHLGLEYGWHKFAQADKLYQERHWDRATEVYADIVKTLKPANDNPAIAAILLQCLNRMDKIAARIDFWGEHEGQLGFSSSKCISDAIDRLLAATERLQDARRDVRKEHGTIEAQRQALQAASAALLERANEQTHLCTALHDEGMRWQDEANALEVDLRRAQAEVTKAFEDFSQALVQRDCDEKNEHEKVKRRAQTQALFSAVRSIASGSTAVFDSLRTLRADFKEIRQSGESWWTKAKATTELLKAPARGVREVAQGLRELQQKPDAKSEAAPEPIQDISAFLQSYQGPVSAGGLQAALRKFESLRALHQQKIEKAVQLCAQAEEARIEAHAAEKTSVLNADRSAEAVRKDLACFSAFLEAALLLTRRGVAGLCQLHGYAESYEQLRPVRTRFSDPGSAEGLRAAWARQKYTSTIAAHHTPPSVSKFNNVIVRLSRETHPDVFADLEAGRTAHFDLPLDHKAFTEKRHVTLDTLCVRLPGAKARNDDFHIRITHMGNAVLRNERGEVFHFQHKAVPKNQHTVRGEEEMDPQIGKENGEKIKISPFASWRLSLAHTEELDLRECEFVEMCMSGECSPSSEGAPELVRRRSRSR